MLVVIGCFVISWAAVDLIGYWLHRLAHRPGSFLYGPHMTHHVQNYPARRFLSDDYRSSGSDSLAVWFAPMFVIYCVICLLAAPWPLSLAFVAGAAPPAIINSVLHDLTHIRRSIAWRCRPLRKYSIGHYAHHRNMRTNFGIATFLWDRIFGTYWSSAREPKVS